MINGTIYTGSLRNLCMQIFAKEWVEYPFNPIVLGHNHTERQASSVILYIINYWSGDACHDAWEWVWDPFWSVTMHSNGTLPLDALLDARCGYAFSEHTITKESLFCNTITNAQCEWNVTVRNSNRYSYSVNHQQNNPVSMVQEFISQS